MMRFVCLLLILAALLPGLLARAYKLDVISLDNAAANATVGIYDRPYIKIMAAGAARTFWAIRAGRLDRVAYDGGAWQVTPVLERAMTDLAPGEDAQTCYVASGGDVLRVTTQAGQSPVEVVTSFSGPAVQALCRDAQAGGNLFVSTTGGTYYLKKNGAAWDRATCSAKAFDQLAAPAGSSQMAIGLNDNGLFCMEDSGTGWTESQVATEYYWDVTPGVAPAGEQVFLASNSIKVTRFRRVGGTWMIETPKVREQAADQTDGGTIKLFDVGTRYRRIACVGTKNGWERIAGNSDYGFDEIWAKTTDHAEWQRNHARHEYYGPLAWDGVTTGEVLTCTRYPLKPNDERIDMATQPIETVEPADVGDWTIATWYYAEWVHESSFVGAPGWHGFYAIANRYPWRIPILYNSSATSEVYRGIPFYSNDDWRTLDWHVKIMREHGINLIIFLWYLERNPDGTLKNVNPTNRALELGFLGKERLGGAPVATNRFDGKMQFAVMWTNHEQDPPPTDLAEYVSKNFFNQPNYYKIDGKPLFIHHTQDNLAVSLGGWPNVRGYLDKFRTDCQSFGSAAPFMGAGYNIVRDQAVNSKNNGYDCAINYNFFDWSGQRSVHRVEPLYVSSFTQVAAPSYHGTDREEDFLTQSRQVYKNLWATNQGVWGKNYLVSTMPMQEMWPLNTPGDRLSVLRATPKNFKLTLRDVKDFVAAKQMRPFFVMECWNEIMEGSYVEPTMEYGYGWVNAVRDEFARLTPTDSDGDGLSDVWELYHFGGLGEGVSGDFDKDGVSNAAEFQAHTDPATAQVGGLPYRTGFEPFTSEQPGFHSGVVHIQDGWQDPTFRSLVTTNAVHGGSQALQVDGNTTAGVTRALDAGGAEEVWIDAWIKMISFNNPKILGAGAQSPNPQIKQAALLTFQKDGSIQVLDGDGAGGGQWVKSAGQMSTQAWTRLTLRLNFKLKRWQIYVNGEVGHAGLGFRDAVAKLEGFQSAAGTSGQYFLDDFACTTAPPAGIAVQNAVGEWAGFR